MGPSWGRPRGARSAGAALRATHAYAESKGAVDGLTRSLAAHYGPRGIRVNAIAPGLVATPMSRRAQEDTAIGRTSSGSSHWPGDRSTRTR